MLQFYTARYFVAGRKSSRGVQKSLIWKRREIAICLDTAY